MFEMHRAYFMSAAVAVQMVKTMNQTMEQMMTPNAVMKHTGDAGAQTQYLNPEENYYLTRNGQAKGPYSLAEMIRMVTTGSVSRETYVWKPGMRGWTRAENVPEILNAIAILPPPVPSSSSDSLPAEKKEESRGNPQDAGRHEVALTEEVAGKQ